MMRPSSSDDDSTSSAFDPDGDAHRLAVLAAFERYDKWTMQWPDVGQNRIERHRPVVKDTPDH